MSTIIIGPERFHGEISNNTSKCRGDFTVFLNSFLLNFTVRLSVEVSAVPQPKNCMWGLVY